MLSRLSVLILIIGLFAVVITDLQASNLPKSRAGTLVESVSPTEVRVRATGIGYWEKGMTSSKDIDKTLTKSAEEDARKAAVYFVLFGGTDPLLKQTAEQAAFEKIQEEFFDLNNIAKFIAWESQDFISRVKKPIEKDKKFELYIEKEFKINKELITNDLINRRILAAKSAVAEIIGLPFIMVIPSVPPGKNPIDALRTDANLSHAAKVIESYLTAKQYDVLVPEQAVDLNELVAAQQAVGNVAADYSYQLALSIGSDVYITYEISIENDKFGTKKASASVRAYETTTARLLGTETGYSPSSGSAPKVLIEAAVNDAIDKVLSRVNAYWKEDIERGIQYKLIVSIAPGFDKDEAEEISFIFADLLEKFTKNKKFKENIVTKQTLDYLMWCDPVKYDKSTKLYRDIKKEFGDKFTDGNLDKININRKLLMLKVDSK